MVTIEQVEQLDERVRRVISLIESLRHENARLFSENRRLLEEQQRLQYHLQEMERRSLALTGNQELLEKGLMGAIDRLESVSQETVRKVDQSSVSLPHKMSSAGLADDEVGDLSQLLEDPVTAGMDHAEFQRTYTDYSTEEDHRMDIF